MQRFSKLFSLLFSYKTELLCFAISALNRLRPPIVSWSDSYSSSRKAINSLTGTTQPDSRYNEYSHLKQSSSCGLVLANHSPQALQAGMIDTPVIFAWRAKQSVNPRYLSTSTSSTFLRLTSPILLVIINAVLARISHHSAPLSIFTPHSQKLSGNV